jgi:putative SOS response-associated peptidase YedK
MTAEGVSLQSGTIITMPPNALMAEIHNAKQRMPAILQSADIEVWLTESTDEARAALKPYPDDLMHAQKVSTRVNSPKNNDEKLLESVS